MVQQGKRKEIWIRTGQGPGTGTGTGMGTDDMARKEPEERDTASSNATLKANPTNEKAARQANTGRLYEVKRDEVPVY